MTSQARKVQITINNPEEKGYTPDKIRAIVDSLNPDYYCFAYERGLETGTMHCHIFFYRSSAIRFSTLQKKLPECHIEFCHGSCKDNRDYVNKSGKWENSSKAETTIPGTFEEFGNLPDAAADAETEKEVIIAELKEGKNTYDIVQAHPKFLFRVRELDALKQLVVSDEQMKKHREIEVHYLYGDTGTGKTRSIFEKHNAVDICRITNYSGSNGVRFDAYLGQPVLVFEEFHSQIALSDMLNYLDRYPLMLPARFSDKVACYTTVYITSNYSLREQYREQQKSNPKVWHAFLRRITTVTEFLSDGFVIHHDKSEFY